MAKSSEGKSGGSEQDKEASSALMTDANSTDLRSTEVIYIIKKSHWTQIKNKKDYRNFKNAEVKNAVCAPRWKAHPLPSARLECRSDRQGIKGGG